MNIREMISVSICSVSWMIGFQLGKENISFWIMILIAFFSGLLVLALLNYEELFKGKKK